MLSIDRVEICHLYVSPGHNFVGHHGREPDTHPMIEVPAIECVAGRGIRGDRYFDFKDDYKGQITFFSAEVFDELCAALKIGNQSPSTARRNVITRRVDLNELVGTQFGIQGVRFFGTEECRPCYWMDRAFASGACDFLKGRGGLRAKILSDGGLRSHRAGFWFGRMKISAVLLAGGESRRMGKDKATLSYRGKPLWQIQLELLRQLTPQEIFISARSDPDWRPADIHFVADDLPSRGPLSGLAASLDRMSTSHLLALAIDMPRMSENFLRNLCDQTLPGCGVLPKIDNRAEPLAAIYPREANGDFRNALTGADFSLQPLVRRLVDTEMLREISVTDEEQKLFWNVNELSDLAAL